MLSFLFKKKERQDESLTNLYSGLKNFYSYSDISEERKTYIKETVWKYGYLPYSHIKALEELSPAEVLYGLEIKWEKEGCFKDGEFHFENFNTSPLIRHNVKNSNWIKKEQHNIKLLNLAGLGNGNNQEETGKFIDWLRQLLILPTGDVEKGVFNTTVYLIPFHPREFGCAYLPSSSEVSPNIEDFGLKRELNLSAKEQVQTFIKLAQLAGHPVIYDVLPQTGRFSKFVLANPNIARWYDIKTLIKKIEDSIEEIANELESDYEKEDVGIIKDILKQTLYNGSGDLSDYYQDLFKVFNEKLTEKKKLLSRKMLEKPEQLKIHKIVKEIVAKNHNKKPQNICEEEHITNQAQTIQDLISKGYWPAPGGAWCSSGVPIFDKMSECGSYPVFRHYDYKNVDVTHFANLDCQTPYYFVCLENGKYNDHVINLFVEQMIKLQQDYNFDGFRVDHIDHVVDEVSEKDGVPISYRAPRIVLNRMNTALKSRIPHFAVLAEYMLWDKFYKEYHEDMKFDLLWGNDIISQFEKTPEQIVKDNQYLTAYNSKNSENPLSILKTYNNQDGEFSAIDQYPGQLGKEGALFKWFKYKFLPGGKLAQRPVMFIDGDESFTKTGIEATIGAEISMIRENDQDFYEKFDAINRFALENEFTKDGEAEILEQDEDGFVTWIISKDPLKTSLLIVANYNPPTEKLTETDSEGNTVKVIKEGASVYDKEIKLPCDVRIVSEYKYNNETKNIEEEIFDEPMTEITFYTLNPSEYRIYKLAQ